MSAVGVSVLASLWRIRLMPAGVKIKYMVLCTQDRIYDLIMFNCSWICSFALKSDRESEFYQQTMHEQVKSPACVFTDPPQRPVTSAQHHPPGPQTAAASRRRPSSQDETGSPRSSDNERSSGRLQTDTGRGCQSDRVKAINMEGTTTHTPHISPPPCWLWGNHT